MRRITATLAVGLVLLFAVTATFAQRDGGPATPQGGARGGGFRGGQIPQGRGGQGVFGRGRGTQVQGTSAIRGLVTAGDTNSPLRRAQVTATSADTRSVRVATTDANGRFELNSLPAGRWTVTAAKGGFVSQQYGQRRSFESVDPIDLGEGTRFTANFTLARGGVIAGRIADEFGDAVTGARVEVLRAQTVQGRRRLTPIAVANQTDDTGAFRVFGLAPGEYYVAARLQAPPIDGGDGPVSFAPTYYPGTANLADAQRVKADAGAEQSGINFTLIPVRAVRVSGTIADSTGAPVQAIVNLIASTQSDGPFANRGNARSQPDGSFTIANVAPGDYVLEAMSAREGGRGNNAANTVQPEVASIPLVVGNDDLAGVSVVTSKGATIKGTVVSDTGTRPMLTGLQVQAQALNGGPRGFGGAAQVSNSGTFDLTGLVGSYVLRVDRIPEGWALKSIVVGGKDVSDAVLEVRGSDQLTARVVLTDRITELTGTVRASGQAATAANIVVFPADAAQWAFPSRRVRSSRIDKTGLFRIRGLPAGQSYLALAVDYLEQGEFQDPEFLQRMKASATSVTLNEGETKNIELELIQR